MNGPNAKLTDAFRPGGGWEGVTGVLIVPLLGVKKRFGIPPFKAFSIKMTRDRREYLVLELVPLHPLRSDKYLLHFKPTLKHNLGDFFPKFPTSSQVFLYGSLPPGIR